MAYKTEERLVTCKTRAIIAATCDECGAEMELMQESIRDFKTTVDGIFINMEGDGHQLPGARYGQRFLLCEDCQNQLENALPNIMQRLHTPPPKEGSNG